MSVEKILLAICKQATEQGTPLIYECHSKVLRRLAKLLNLYGQAQASRLGLNVA